MCGRRRVYWVSTSLHGGACNYMVRYSDCITVGGVCVASSMVYGLAPQLIESVLLVVVYELAG